MQNNFVEEQMKKFVNLNLEEKKKLCLTVLSWVKDLWWLFTKLYNLVDSWNAKDKDYNDIYKSAMHVLNDSEGKKVQESMNNLEIIHSNLIATQKQEQLERELASNEADTILNTI